jgi:hypothetical protein
MVTEAAVSMTVTYIVPTQIVMGKTILDRVVDKGIVVTRNTSGPNQGICDS